MSQCKNAINKYFREIINVEVNVCCSKWIMRPHSEVLPPNEGAPSLVHRWHMPTPNTDTPKRRRHKGRDALMNANTQLLTLLNVYYM